MELTVVNLCRASFTRWPGVNFVSRTTTSCTCMRIITLTHNMIPYSVENSTIYEKSPKTRCRFSRDMMKLNRSTELQSCRVWCVRQNYGAGLAFATELVASFHYARALASSY